MVAIKRQLVARRTNTYAGTNGRRFITIHETANTRVGANAQAHANLQTNGFAASFHWQVDDKQAIQSYPHTVRCWHAGDGKGAGNYSSIGVEICVNSDGNFRKALENAAKLVRKIMADEGIPLANVVQHNRWSGKNCPTNLRNGSKGVNWTQFLRMVEGASLPASSGNTSNAVLVLKYGDIGADVRLFQDKLSRAGYAITVDGSFGPAMRATVERFQRDHKLEVDGFLGPITQRKLDEVLIAARKATEGKAKEDDVMAQQLPKTQQDDMRILLAKAFKDGVFHVDHTKKVDTMTRGQALDLLISYVSRQAE